MEQTVSKRDSTAPQKSSLCHHDHKQVRELLHLSNNILDVVFNHVQIPSRTCCVLEHQLTVILFCHCAGCMFLEDGFL